MMIGTGFRKKVMEQAGQVEEIDPGLMPRTSYAYLDEDVWIREQFDPAFQGYACELGALDGKYLSNTLLLEEAGWTVLSIEPNPRHWAALRENRKLVQTYACAAEPADNVPMYEPEVENWTWSTVSNEPLTDAQERIYGNHDLTKLTPAFYATVRTLDFCLEEARFPRLDVLSLDVDGIELEVLKGFTFALWKPRIIVVEEASTSNLLRGYIASFGYVEKHRIGLNSMMTLNPS